MDMKQFILTLISICLIFGCTKETVDYRKKYTGSWFFKVHRSEHNTKYIGYHLSDSLEFVGHIELASNTKEIRIKYTPDDEITAEIDEKGNFIFPKDTRMSSGVFEGVLKVNVILNSGGRGGGIYHEITGSK